MKNILQTTALLSALTTCVLGAADLINGNWYGQAVDRIIYDGWDSSGTYNEVVDMSNGQCKMQPTTFSGSLSPLNEEVSSPSLSDYYYLTMSQVSWHFRGPMHLKQFAFYTPGSSSKRSLRPTPQQRRHVHGHAEKAVGDWVTATINGNVVSWINEYAGVPTSSPTTSASSSILLASSTSALTTTTPSATLPSPSALAAPALNAGAGNWGRQAYYNAANGTADGLVFLNNMGGQESGVFDMTFGNSLSYAAANALSGSATPQVLADTLIPDNNEIIIYTDQQCQGNDCGYYRPGSVAYHGFAGDSKLFLMEFDMPLSGKTGWNMDMPAAWMLNAKIARTQQYGNCSCWASGCGKYPHKSVFQVLIRPRQESGMSSKDSIQAIQDSNQPCMLGLKVAALQTILPDLRTRQ